MSSVAIEKAVGLGARNDAIDTALIQRLLKDYYTAQKKAGKKDAANYASLNVNGRSSPFLIEAIKEFQSTVVGTKKPDGKIDPGRTTFNKLLKAQSTAPTTVRDSILGTEADIHSIKLSSLPTAQFKTFFKQYYGLTTTKGEDLSGFVDMIKADPEITDVRWAAYMLATAYIETAFSFKPIREDGQGAGKKYAKEVEVIDKDGIRGKKNEKYKNVYYGRGYVQLTWDANYKKLGKAIGQGDKLYIDPDLALDEDIAYKVASYGMRHGTFTSVKLSDHLSGSKTEYKRARAIINGEDRSDDIADYSKTIELLLRLAIKPHSAKGV